MKPSSLLFLVTAPLTAASAIDSQATPAPATAQASASTAWDPNRQICKSEEVTGTRLGSKKVCMTAAQWKERAFREGNWLEHQTTYNSQPNGR
jgi:hypothetical protein